MTFDAVFTLRSRLPELFQAGVSVGAMAAFSSLGCAALHALSRRIGRSSSLTLLLLLFLVAPEGARALDFRRDQDTRIGSDETISEALVCTGDVVTIDGTVDGDLFIGAERATMRGTVTGNLYVFGSEVEIDGVVEGSVLAIGDSVRVGGRVDGGVILAGERTTIVDDARIARDVALFGDGARLEAKVNRDVTFAGDWIEVSSEIGRNLNILGADRIALLDGARIGGDVRARLWGRDDELEQAPGARIDGELQIERESIVHDRYLARYREPGYYVKLAVFAASAFVYGLLMYLLDPRLFAADLPDVRGFGRAIGIGFVALMAGPIALLLIGMTVIGIPVAVLGLFILISAVYSAWVLVAGLVGQVAVRPSGSGLGGFAPSMLVGVLILGLTAALPFIGPAVRIVAVLFGLGCLAERVRGLRALDLRGVRG